MDPGVLPLRRGWRMSPTPVFKPGLGVGLFADTFSRRCIQQAKGSGRGGGTGGRFREMKGEIPATPGVAAGLRHVSVVKAPWCFMVFSAFSRFLQLREVRHTETGWNWAREQQ